MSVSVLQAGPHVSNDEEEKEEDEESGNVDDDEDMFKVLSDMLGSESLRIQEWKSAKFGYLPMMVVVTLGALRLEA